jgi:hypothetical protein
LKKNITPAFDNKQTTRNDRYDEQQKTSADINPDFNDLQNPFSFNN